MTQRTLSTLVIVAAAYVAAQIMADIASLRIVMLGGFSVDAGTLVYPFTFTLRDLVHKMTNKQTARSLIIAAAVINLVMAGVFTVAAALPPDPEVGPQVEFGMVLAPVWRIVFASISAEIISEFIDSEVYERWVNRFGQKMQWGRVLSSNAVAVPIDSVIFCLIAFAGALPTAIVISIIWANILIKGATTLISIPLIYAVPELDRVVPTKS